MKSIAKTPPFSPLFAITFHQTLTKSLFCDILITIMVIRQQYLDQLIQLQDQPLIKVITGIRRSGKSTLLDQFRQHLLQQGVSPDRVISLNFEAQENEFLLDRHRLHDYLTAQLLPDQKNYIFLDEIQNVPQFEKLVDSLFIKTNVDLYITGSNAFLLSSELATLLSGRYLEINLLPFSFAEYLQAQPSSATTDLHLSLDRFLHTSAFPQAVTLSRLAPDQALNYTRTIYQTVVTKDIGQRQRIKHPRTFDHLTKFLLDNLGNPTSPHNLARTLSTTDSQLDSRLIERYLSALASSYVFYPVSRFDIRGKQHLNTQEKYYTVDLGFRQALIGKTTAQDLGHLLENLVYLELRRRGGCIYLGKLDQKEVDFVVQQADGSLSYYQVAYTAKDPDTLKRELTPLQKIPDNYPKYLLTTDPLSFDQDGIQHFNVCHWLLHPDASC